MLFWYLKYIGHYATMDTWHNPRRSDQNKRGRPLKRNGRKLIKFYADNDDAAYLDAVKAARGLPSVAEAGRLVLSDAHAQRRFLEGHVSQ